MSTSIDSRVVSMKFDGSQFKRSASEALGLLDKLKAKMNEHALGRGITKGAGMAGNFLSAINPINLARKALGGLQGDVNKFNMNGVEQSTSGVSKSFLAMATVGITALANLTNRAVDAGLRFAKSFTVGPILDGLHEYETNLKSIQTIQANTDKPLPVITRALQELNRYSDQTIYNFGEMARNIGTFTAAGVGLKDSVSSIKGIANMAALSGSTSEQASTAMYQLSQAIASGKVGLMDWNSVVNAGMGGKKLQNALAQTAIAMGEIDKAQVKGTASGKQLTIMGDSFRNSIMAKPGSESWLTSGVLVNTLASLDGRFSKAALSQELLANGTRKYNSEAQVNAQIEKNRQALAAKGIKFSDEQFKAMMKLSDAAFKSATEVKTLGQVFDIARETLGSGWAATFQNIFGNLTEAKTLFTGMSDSINAFINANSLARNNVLADWKELGGRTDLIEGIKNVFTALGHILGPIGQAFRDVFPRKTGQDLANITKNFRQFTETLIAGEGTMSGIRSTFKGVFAILSIGVNIVANVIRYFLTLGQLLLGLGGNGGGILAVTGSIGDLLGKIQEWLVQGGRIDAFFTKIIEGRAALFGPIIAKVAELVGWLVKLVESAAGDALGWIADHADEASALAASFKAMAESGIDAALEFLKPYADDAKALAEGFKAIVSSGLENFMDKLKGGFDGLKPMLDDLTAKIKGGADLKDLFDFGDSASKAEAGINRVKDAMGGSDAVADRARAAWEKVVEVFRKVGDILAPVGDAIKQAFGNLKGLVSQGIDNLSFSDIVKAVNVGIFAGLLIMFRNFGKKFGSVMDGIKGVLGSGSGVLDQLKGNLKSMQNEVRADMILKIAAAVGILAVSLLILSRIPAKELGISLGAVAVMLIMLTRTMAVLNKQADGMNAIDAGKMVLLSVSLSALGVAMVALAVAVALFGNMDTGTLVKGITSIAAVMVVMAGAAALMGGAGGAGLLAASIGITILAAGLTALAGAILLYSKLDLGAMAEGGAKIAGLLVALGIAMMFMQGSLGGAAALFIIAAALTALIPSLLVFSNMDGDQIKMMVISLGALFAVLALAGVAAPLIAALAAAMLTFGVAVLALGAGLALLGVGFSLFAASLVVIAASGTAAFAVLSGAVTLFLAMFPFWMQQLDIALQALSGVIRRQGPPMVAAFGAVLRALLVQVAQSAPALGRALGALITAGLNVMRTKFPQVVSTGLAMVESLLRGIRNNVTRIVPLAIDIVVKYMNTIANNMGRIIASGTNLIIKFLQGIANAIPRIAPKATDVVVRFIQAIGNHAQRVTLAGVDMVIKLVNGVANGIRARQGEMNAAGRNLASAIISGMVSGIAGGISAVTSAARNLASNALSAAKGVLGIHSPSREFMKVGAFTADGLALGMDQSVGTVQSSAENMAQSALDTLQYAMSKVNDAVPAAVDLSPTITPVLDLTKLQNEAAKIGSALDPGAIRPTVSFAKALSILEDEVGEDKTPSAPSGPSEVNVTQINNSPRALSATESYRNMHNAVSLAKEALGVK